MSDRRRFESEWVMSESKAHSEATRCKELQDLQDLVHDKNRNSKWRLWLDNNTNNSCSTIFDDRCFDASTIAEALQNNRTITSIELAHVSNGTHFLVEMLSPCLLSENSRIKSLTLFSCGDCGDIFAALLRRQRNNLEWLELSASGMTDAGAIDIATILKTNNETLKYLKLDWNRIGIRGENCLLQSLYVNTNLRSIGLYSSGLSEKAIAQAEILISRRSERDFELWFALRRKPINSSCSLEKMRRGLQWYCAAQEYDNAKVVVSRIKERLALEEEDNSEESNNQDLKDIVVHAMRESGNFSDESFNELMDDTV